MPADVEFIARLNAGVVQSGYNNRSQFIRDAIVEKLAAVGIEIPKSLTVSQPQFSVPSLNDAPSSIVHAAAIAAAKKAVQIVENEPVTYRRKRRAGSSSGQAKPPTPSAEAR